MKIRTKKDRRERIQLRQRKRIHGTAERPRLAVFRSVAHIYAQVMTTGERRRWPHQLRNPVSRPSSPEGSREQGRC
jgi:hypothetical protein